MFKYTNFLDKPAEPPKPLKIGRRGSTIPKPLQGSERPTSATFSEAKQKTSAKPLNDITVSERYTNRAYNRLPSPKERFQTLANAGKDNRPSHTVGKPSTVEDRRNMAAGRLCEKVKSSSPRPRQSTQGLQTNQSCSEINKKRPLEMQCDKTNISCKVESRRARPKTSDCSRTESNLEYKVLNTVSKILSQAVMQQGKIDETNFENIMDNMRNRLNMDDDEMSDIDIDFKPSRTTVNEINLSENNSENKNIKKMAGIVRKNNLSTKSEQKPYRRIYDQMGFSPLMNSNVSEGDGETLVYVDLPDTDYLNFTPSEKTRVNPRIEITVSKQNIKVSSSKKDVFSKQFEVGDSQMKSGNNNWNPSEDAKLRTYVETLIQSMKRQMNSENSSMETEGEIDSQGTVCRSFCVCKVCVSKNSRSKEELKPKPSVMESPSVVVLDKPKLSKPIVRRPVRSGQKKPEIQQGANNRLRLLKPSSNDMETVIKNTNPNFKSQWSSLNTSLNLPSVKKESYTVVNSTENTEDKDNMYLQRRIRKSPNMRSNVKTK